MMKQEKNFLVFGYGLGIIAAGFGAAGIMKHGMRFVPLVLLCCSAVFVGVTAFDVNALKPAYRGWMAAAHAIGAVVTTVILGVVFILIFVPVGVFLKLAGKDHLQRRFDRSAQTYWIRRNEITFQKERYHQQF